MIRGDGTGPELISCTMKILDSVSPNNIEFIDSIPKCSVFNILEETLFEKTSKETYIERILQQFFMILSKFGSEGGLFIFIGKKK